MSFFFCLGKRSFFLSRQEIASHVTARKVCVTYIHLIIRLPSEKTTKKIRTENLSLWYEWLWERNLRSCRAWLCWYQPSFHSSVAGGVVHGQAWRGKDTAQTQTQARNNDVNPSPRACSCCCSCSCTLDPSAAPSASRTCCTSCWRRRCALVRAPARVRTFRPSQQG